MIWACSIVAAALLPPRLRPSILVSVAAATARPAAGHAICRRTAGPGRPGQARHEFRLQMRAFGCACGRRACAVRPLAVRVGTASDVSMPTRVRAPRLRLSCVRAYVLKQTLACMLWHDASGGWYKCVRPRLPRAQDAHVQQSKSVRMCGS